MTLKYKELLFLQDLVRKDFLEISEKSYLNNEQKAHDIEYRDDLMMKLTFMMDQEALKEFEKQEGINQ